MKMEEWEEYKYFIDAVEEKAATISEDPVLKSVASYIFNTKGKKLRPLVIMLSCGACGGDFRSVVDASLAVEAIHTASLVHDDILDDGSMRRDLPSVHEKFGVMAAILCGDFLISNSIKWISPYGQKVIYDFGHSGHLLCEGEVMDSSIERGKMTVNQYMECIYKKTAALFEISARIGARVGSSDDESLVSVFGKFGREFGMAYQVVDDLLEDFGIYKDKESGILSDSLFSIYSRTKNRKDAAKNTLCVAEKHLSLSKDALKDVKSSASKTKLLYLVDSMYALLDHVRENELFTL